MELEDLPESERKTIELDSFALAGLKKMPVDIFDNVYVGEAKNTALVLCVDVRNFSDFLCCNDEDDVFALIRDFTTNLLSCVNQCGYNCSYYKLMGDGAIVIWDEASTDHIREAIDVFNSYTSFVNEDLFKPHPSLGLGGALVIEKVYKYEISAEASELKYRDYVGYAINLACRLQNLATANQLIFNKNLSDRYETNLKRISEGPLFKELHSLKGLKEEDRTAVLVYEQEGC